MLLLLDAADANFLETFVSTDKYRNGIRLELDQLFRYRSLTIQSLINHLILSQISYISCTSILLLFAR